MAGKKCLIIEEMPSNLAILTRLADSFELPTVNIEEPLTALKYFEEKSADLVIIDTDYLKGTTAKDLTASLKRLNPQCIVVWLCAHEPYEGSATEARPDVLLKKPIGMRQFQEALVPYLFPKTKVGDNWSLN